MFFTNFLTKFDFFPIFSGFTTPSHYHTGLRNTGTPVPWTETFFWLGNASRPVWFEGILLNWMLLSIKNTIIEKGFMFVDIILYCSKMNTKSITYNLSCVSHSFHGEYKIYFFRNFRTFWFVFLFTLFPCWVVYKENIIIPNELILEDNIINMRKRHIWVYSQWILVQFKENTRNNESTLKIVVYPSVCILIEIKF